MMQEFFSEVSVGINEADAVSEGDVLDDEVSKKCGFAGPRFSNNVDMLALVLLGDAKTLGSAPAFAFSDDDAWFRFQNQPPLLQPGNPVSSRPPRSPAKRRRQGVWGHAGEVMAADFEIRTENSNLCEN